LRLWKSRHIIHPALLPAIIELERTKREWFDRISEAPESENTAPRQTNYLGPITPGEHT
jgi:hypothetical protein